MKEASRHGFHPLRSLYIDHTFALQLYLENSSGIWFLSWGYALIGFPRRLSGKESACSAGDTGDLGLIPGLGRSPRGGYGNPLHYFCLENFMDRGAWPATVHGVAKSQTQLKWLSMHTHICILITKISSLWWETILFCNHKFLGSPWKWKC